MIYRSNSRARRFCVRNKSRALPFLIGITGNVACGKTMVSKIFRQVFNIPVFSADRVVAELYMCDKGLVEVALSVAPTLVINGIVDKHALVEGMMARCFNPEPIFLYLQKKTMAKLQEFRICRKTQLIAAAEIPLLFELGLEHEFDVILTVVADSKLRRSRAHSNPKLLLGFDFYNNRQWPEVIKASRSDFVIDNNLSTANIYCQVCDILASTKRHYIYL